MGQPIYFDYAATTPVRPEAREALLRALDGFGNPSSRYGFGREAALRVKADRETVAAALGCAPGEVVFTSCGTEGDNWALRRGAERNRRRGRHIVTTAIEHAAVLETCKDLEGEGWEITRLKPDRGGRITPEQVRAALRPDTALVSMMLVNNETGAVLPAAESVKAVKAADPAILFHCDGVQGFLKMDCPLARLGADLIAVSGHKIGAPKGIGALYVKKGVRLRPLLTGGGQEDGLRSGTEATAQIAAFAAAVEAAGACPASPPAASQAARPSQARIRDTRPRPSSASTPHIAAPISPTGQRPAGCSALWTRLSTSQSVQDPAPPWSTT